MRKLRFTRSSSFFAAALLLAGVVPLGSAAPAGAEPGDRTVTVAPSTGLGPGQTVTVSGSGFNPSVSVAVVECHGVDNPSTGDCNVGQVKFLTSGADGSFSTPLTVSRFLVSGSSVIDCAAAAGTCNVVGVEMSDFSLRSYAPLEFDPDAALPPVPALVVTPSTGLVDKQAVDVGGTGFTPSRSYQLEQCVAGSEAVRGCTDVHGYAWSDPGGVLDGSIVLRRIIDAPGGSVDCASAPGTCELLAFASSPDAASLASLDFDPDGPMPVPPSVTVEPATGLLDRQQVTISGTGFVGGAWVDISTCEVIAGEVSYVCRWYDTNVTTDETGAFTTTLGLRRLLSGGDDVVDCAVASCVVQAVTYDQLYERATSPVAFDPDAPLPPPPSLTADPSTGLADRQVVTLSGSGWTPGAYVSLEQCGDDPDGQMRCGYGFFGNVHVADDGTLTAQFRVRREIKWTEWDDETEEGVAHTIDCADEPGRCYVQAYSDAEWPAQPAVPLTFDPDAPPGPGPVIAVTPTAGLVDEQEVTVEGSGFVSGEFLYVGQCAAPAVKGATPSPCLNSTYLNAGPDGTIESTLEVRRLVGGFGGDPVDCAEAEGRCVVRASNGFDEDSTLVPLSFDPDGPLPPRPTVRVVPEVGLADGQTVEVQGSGFSPNASVALAECRSDAKSTGGCDIYRFKTVAASASGDFTTSFVVDSTLDAGGQTVDCAAEPGACGIGAGNMAYYIEGAVGPITFGDPPVVSVGDVSTPEGDAGASTVAVPLTLSTASQAPVSVHYDVVAGSAHSPDDFVAASGDAVFAPGETNASVPVEITGDTLDEDAETFQVVLSDPRHSALGAATSTVTVVDDDAPVAVNPLAGTVTEGNRRHGRFVSIPVTLSAPSGKTVTVRYRTKAHTATPGSDFWRTSGVVTFAPGQTSAVVKVEIVGDRRKEPQEVFLLRFSKATNATIGGIGGLGFGVVVDDD